ncbi:DUF2911 domain-containing protein [Lutimonas sp.]|jgi:hypothetical protein|uniref:DUF2911 domain-containing protein n=1 Tax=Lutimonas sp. TaxID=1872403 RepID=UPI003C790FA2
MKKIYINLGLACIFTYFFSVSLNAQEFRNLDTSPHDIVYFRTNKISPPKIKVLYGRPKKNGREIFGNVIPYGKIWRVGANEATEVVFYNDVVFGETEVKAGTYVLYAIPEQNEWTLILSSNTDVWGTYEYEDKYDVARTTAKVSKAEFLEAFSIGFKDKGKHVNMVLAWDTTRITAPIKIIL